MTSSPASSRDISWGLRGRPDGGFMECTILHGLSHGEGTFGLSLLPLAARQGIGDN